MLNTLNCSVIIPVYNSELSLLELISEIDKALTENDFSYEVIMVDDCSSDNSWKIIRQIVSQDSRVTGIQLMRNTGQGSATLAGIEQASGEFIVTIDDDLQHPPGEIPVMLKHLIDNPDLDVVIGSHKVKKHNIVRRFGSRIVNKLNTLFLSKPDELKFTGFRVMRSNIAHALLQLNIPYPALGPMIISTTQRVCNIEVKHLKRAHGKSNYNLKRLLKQFLSNFIGYSVLPLHLLAFVGSIGVIVSMLFGVYFLARYIIVGVSVPGWTTLLLVLLVLSGFTFLSFAIIGEYILRVNQVSTNVSKWNVRNKISSDSSN